MDEAINAPGYPKTREKLNPEAQLRLAQQHVAIVYANGDYRAHKGMLAIGASSFRASLSAPA